MKKEIGQKLSGGLSASEMLSFRDLAPTVHVDGSPAIPDVAITKIIALVKVANANIKGDDLKTIVSELDSHLCGGMEPRVVLHLVAVLILVSRYLKDGKNLRKLADYLKLRIAYAAFYCGWRGGDLLWVVVGDVKVDLLDCKCGREFLSKRNGR